MTAELIDFRLLAALPAIIVVLSSLLVRYGASDAVKQLLPWVVTGVLVVAYYVSQSWPDQWALVVGQIAALVTVAGKVYDTVNQVTKSTAGKSLNEVTGRGVVG